MRVIIAHDVADDLGAFAIGPPRDHAAFLRGKQNTAMDRLEAIADIGQCARHDHAHCVIEIARLHLIDDVDAGVLAGLRGGIKDFGVVAHAEKSYPVGGKGELKALGQVFLESQQTGRESAEIQRLFHICDIYAEWPIQSRFTADPSSATMVAKPGNPGLWLCHWFCCGGAIPGRDHKEVLP